MISFHNNTHYHYRNYVQILLNKNIFSTMDYKPLLPEKQSSGDEGRQARPEQLRYLSTATWFSKLTFDWIFPVIKVTPPSRSTAINRTSSRTTLKIFPWTTSRSRSTASGIRIGRPNLGPILMTRLNSLSSRPSTVFSFPFRAIYLGDGHGLSGISIYCPDAADHFLHLHHVGESTR